MKTKPHKPKKRPKTNANGLRIPRQVRVVLDPIQHAIDGATKPSPGQIAQIKLSMQAAAKAMREGVGTERDWSVLAGELALAIAIERGGIVRGLMGHFESFDRVLQAIHDRCSKPVLVGQPAQWQRTALWHYELDELRNFIDLHSYQLTQLSRSELEAALDKAQNNIISNGDTVQVIRDVPAFAQSHPMMEAA